MPKPLRLVLASIAVVISGLPILLAAEQATLVYYLPPIGPGQPASRHTTIYQPALVAAAVASLMTLLIIGWLIYNIVGKPRNLLWMLPVAGLLVSYLAVVAVLGMDRPNF